MPEAGGRGRVLSVSHYFDGRRGGVELVAGRLAEELAVAGFSSRWLSTAGAVPTPSARVRTIAVGASDLVERSLGLPFPLPDFAGVARIARQVRAADAVLVHDALYPTSVLAVLTAKAWGKPVTVVQHIGAVPYRSPFLRWAMSAANVLVARPLLAGADQVVFISETTQRFFGEVKFRRPPLCIFNGVDGERFRPPRDAEAQRARRAELNLPEAGPIAAFVGRFVEKKGLHWVEAAARLRPDVIFVLAGSGAIAPEAWGLPNVLVRRGLGPAEVARLYQAADVLLLPSVGEGLPLVVQEALAAGLPVVCGAETAMADPDATALLSGVDLAQPPGITGPALARALDEAIAADDPTLSARRRAYALARYSWSAAGTRYAAVLDAQLRARRPRATTTAKPAGAAA